MHRTRPWMAVVSYSVSFFSSNPEDTANADKNDYVAKLYDGTTLVHAYVSPDNIQYGVQDVKVLSPAPPTVRGGVGSKVEFEAHFDKRNEPDPSCTTSVELDGPGGVCVTCEVTGG